MTEIMTTNPAQLRSTESFLCYAWGETDHPIAQVVITRAEVQQFLVSEWLGDVDSDELPEIMAEFDKHQNWSQEHLEWKFEIGGVRIEKIYSMLPARQSARNRQPSGPPSGWKLVPVEPTERMIISGFESAPDSHFSPDLWKQQKKMSGCEAAAFRAKLCYSAMLAAAPAEPQGV